MRARGLFAAALCLVSFAPGCKNKNATPVGAVVLDWDPSDSTRSTFLKASIGARTRKNVRMTLAPPEKDGPAQLLLAIEVAPVDFEENGKIVHHTSVVSLRAAVEKNEDWTISTECRGPDLRLDVGPDGPRGISEDMVVRCTFELDNGRTLTYWRELWMQGDGVVKPSDITDVKMTLETVKP